MGRTEEAREHIGLQHEGSLGLRHYILEDESVRQVPDGSFHGGQPDFLPREQGMQDPGDATRAFWGKVTVTGDRRRDGASSAAALNLVKAHQLL